MKNAIAAALLMSAATPVVAQTAVPTSKVTYIHAGALLDRPGQAPRGNSTIIVRDGKIAEVRDGFVPPETGAKPVSYTHLTLPTKRIV